MTPLDTLAEVIRLPAIAGLPAKAAFERRDTIKRAIADHIATEPTAHWLQRMQPADIWCAEVLDWPELFASEAFRRMDMLQTLIRAEGLPVRTTRSPIRIDGRREQCRSAAPRIGEHTEALRAEFGAG